MSKYIVTNQAGEPVYEVHKVHPIGRFLGNTLLVVLLLGAPLAIPSPLVYFLAPVAYILELVVVRAILPTGKGRRNRNGLAKGEKDGNTTQQAND